MNRTGILRIEAQDSRLDGTLLAVDGRGDPLGAATSFVLSRDLHDRDRITVTGEDGMLGNRAVIFMTAAVLAVAAGAAERVRGGMRAMASKPARTPTPRTPSKRTSPARAAKKSGAKSSKPAKATRKKSRAKPSRPAKRSARKRR